MKLKTIVFVLCAAGALFAQSPQMRELLRNYGGDRAVSAEFELVTYFHVREREEKRNGEMHVVPGDKFRVTLGRDVFVSDGVTFWQFNERNAQVVVRHFSDIDPNTLPSAMLSSFLRGRTFTETPQENSAMQFHWQGNDGEYKEITVTADNRAVIKTLRLIDRHDNIHTYTFSKTTFDRPPRNDTFRFSAPRGTETLDMRE